MRGRASGRDVLLVSFPLKVVCCCRGCCSYAPISNPLVTTTLLSYITSPAYLWFQVFDAFTRFLSCLFLEERTWGITFIYSACIFNTNHRRRPFSKTNHDT